MIRRILTVLLASLAGTAFAQQDQGYLHNRAVMERVQNLGTSTSISLGNMGVSNPGLIGDVYLYLEYRATTFWLYEGDQVLQNVSAKLDLQRNEFDLYYASGVRAFSGSKVKTLLWTDGQTMTPQYYVNAKEYKNDEGTPYLGFFQILSEGEVTLLKMTELIFKPADRNPTHSTGSKDNRFLKKVELYYAIGTMAEELPNKKGIRKLFESRKEEIDKFIELNELDLDKEFHLVILFDYYNSLIKK